jgi:hypothetical protein
MSISSERLVKPTRSAESTLTTRRSRRSLAAVASGDPQAMQKRASARLSVPQLAHATTAPF